MKWSESIAASILIVIIIGAIYAFYTAWPTETAITIVGVLGFTGLVIAVKVLGDKLCIGG